MTKLEQFWKNYRICPPPPKKKMKKVNIKIIWILQFLLSIPWAFVLAFSPQFQFILCYEWEGGGNQMNNKEKKCLVHFFRQKFLKNKRSIKFIQIFLKIQDTFLIRNRNKFTSSSTTVFGHLRCIHSLGFTGYVRWACVGRWVESGHGRASGPGLGLQIDLYSSWARMARGEFIKTVQVFWLVRLLIEYENAECWLQNVCEPPRMAWENHGQL